MKERDCSLETDESRSRREEGLLKLLLFYVSVKTTGEFSWLHA
jgi:hypothetical protein